MKRCIRRAANLPLVALLLCGAASMGCGSGGAGPSTSASTPVEQPSSGPGTSNGSPAGATTRGLAGTTWRLVEIQSMDDAIGTVRPVDPAVFTMQLNEGGSVNFRLDCNRGTGTWSAEPASGSESGRFEFGRLAVTRALCPPPHLDERLAAQTEFVRSYLLRDGRLHLSLMADGGILVWEPLSDESGTE